MTVNHSQSIDTLRKALQRLPGVGPKTAQRMAFHLLERDREGAKAIADALAGTVDELDRWPWDRWGGWAWGGGFIDFDNDGREDLYTPNGFISGPSLKDT